MSLFLLTMMFNIRSYLTLIHSLCNRTFKKGWPAHISLRANDRGSALQVKSVCFDHNHEDIPSNDNYCNAKLTW